MIHSSAIVDPTALIADDVTIGPYSIIGKNVEIGSGCDIKSHVIINGPTTIGANNQIFPFCSIGEDPQDKKYKGEATVLEIGDNNLIRENVTINRGTLQGGGITKIGHDNWIMAYVHIAHDCLVGNHTIMANNATLAGHVVIEDYVILGGSTLISQFNAIGAHSFTAMGSVISRHVPPYLLVSGHMAKPFGINSEGLRRRDFSPSQIRNIKQAYKLIYRSGLPIEQAEDKLNELEQVESELDCFISFLREHKGGIIR